VDNKPKILYISSQNPYENYGGAIGARRIYFPLVSLQEKNQIELRSIILCSENFKTDKFTNDSTDFIKKRNYDKCLAKIKRVADYLELHKSEILDIFLKFKPNIVILQCSRLGNIAEYLKIKSNKIKQNFCIINNFDNFELEFAKAAVKYTLPKFLWKYKFKIVKKSEYKSIKHANSLLFLTKTDEERVHEFYKVNGKKSYVMPLYYEDPLSSDEYKKIEHSIKDKNALKMVFTGSLDYSPNIEAGLFLIRNFQQMRKVMHSDFEIIIAGRNPHSLLIQESKEESSVKIVANPSNNEMNKILLGADLFISPVFEGSGMKTKIVEALAHGLPIIASYHSLIGYEFLDSYINDIIFDFKDKDEAEFLSKLETWEKNYKKIGKENFFYKARSAYKKHFSFNQIEAKIFSIIENCFDR
jgi:glycosyltransferase involved in cell wall biosynthesis